MQRGGGAPPCRDQREGGENVEDFIGRRHRQDRTVGHCVFCSQQFDTSHQTYTHTTSGPPHRGGGCKHASKGCVRARRRLPLPNRWNLHAGVAPHAVPRCAPWPGNPSPACLITLPRCYGEQGWLAGWLAGWLVAMMPDLFTVVTGAGLGREGIHLGDDGRPADHDASRTDSVSMAPDGTGLEGDGLPKQGKVPSRQAGTHVS